MEGKGIDPRSLILSSPPDGAALRAAAAFPDLDASRTRSAGVAPEAATSIIAVRASIWIAAPLCHKLCRAIQEGFDGRKRLATDLAMAGQESPVFLA